MLPESEMYNIHEVKHHTFNSGKNRLAILIQQNNYRIYIIAINLNDEDRLIHEFTTKFKNKNKNI